MGFFDKIKKIGIFNGFSQLDDDFYDELEESLILADMGAETTMEAVEDAAPPRARRKRSRTWRAPGPACVRSCADDLHRAATWRLDMSTEALRGAVHRRQRRGQDHDHRQAGAQLKARGQKGPACAPADTFRAAAAEQLTIWAERAGVDIVKQHEGADPAAVVFDAMQRRQGPEGATWCWCDTAGRLHNKQNLMNELNKISRVIDRELPGCAPGDPAGAGRHHRTERPDPGQAVRRRPPASPASCSPSWTARPRAAS